MDIDAEAGKLRKKLEKIQWQVNKQSRLKYNKKKEDEFDDIKEKLKAFEDKLTPLGVTKLVHKTHQH